MLFIMSQMEFSRLTVLQDLAAGRLEPGQAAQILNLSRRRLMRRFESAGARPRGLRQPDFKVRINLC